MNDQQGVVEIAHNPFNVRAAAAARGLLQTVKQIPIQWAFATPRPLLSFLGPAME